MNIEVPIDPSELHLPRSVVQFQLGSGVFKIIGFPMQGVKTHKNIVDTLKIWEKTIVSQDHSLALYDPEFRWSQMLSRK